MHLLLPLLNKVQPVQQQVRVHSGIKVLKAVASTASKEEEEEVEEEEVEELRRLSPKG